MCGYFGYSLYSASIKGNDGKWLLLEYMSHLLSATKSNYSSTKQDFLAVILGLKH